MASIQKGSIKSFYFIKGAFSFIAFASRVNTNTHLKNKSVTQFQCPRWDTVYD